MINKTKEVYIAYGVSGEVLYVGQGNRGRNTHCYSGSSHNKKLNRYYFLNGEDGSIITKVVHLTDCEKDSLEVERRLIKELSPTCNNSHQIRPEVMIMGSFKLSGEEYYRLQQELRDCSCLVMGEKIKNEMLEITNSNREFSEILDVIGIEDIKSTSFHKTKSKAKYKKIVGINEITKSKASAFRNLKVRNGDFLTYSEIKDRLQKCFDKMGVDAVAKATDIKEVYNVKRTARQGVEGFLIGERI